MPDMLLSLVVGAIGLALTAHAAWASPRVCAYLCGMWEFRRQTTTHYGPDLIETYDAGRDMAHCLTLRYWDR